MTISEKLAALPDSPGVYIMKNKNGTIIYVGKAKILKNRVRQYFHDSANHTAKVRAMVSNIADFEYIVCDSEYEALCLESNLIKQNLPRYNILLKDDKNYPFLKVTLGRDYPQLTVVRKIENDGAKYFGPYPGRGTVKDTMDAVKKIFKIQHCKKSFPRDIGKERPCIYYSMGRCCAPCRGEISSREYKEQMKNVCDFLEGNHEKLIDDLKTQMQSAAEILEFERAASLRNKIYGIQKLDSSQKVISEKTRDIDVIAALTDGDISVFRIFFIRHGKMIGNDTFFDDSSAFLDDGTLGESFLRAYYDSSVTIPDVVLCNCQDINTDDFSRWLTEKREKKAELRIPQRGEGKALMDMALRNAKISLSQRKIDILTKSNKEKACKELAEYIGLKAAPKRIEAYDISNTGGSENVASMIVFENGRPQKKEYKKFKIKYIVGSNDYDCMREALSRRFMRYIEGDENFSKLPDLIFVDGGLGHLNVALEALSNLDIYVPVFGMVKDDRHRTRGLIGTGGEVALPMHGSAFRLVTFIQDEAHRFAITYHKKLRNKKTFESDLDGIKGVGDKRKKLLLKHFKSVSAIKNASIDELTCVKGIDKSTAENIYNFFNGRSDTAKN